MCVKDMCQAFAISKVQKMVILITQYLSNESGANISYFKPIGIPCRSAFSIQVDFFGLCKLGQLIIESMRVKTKENGEAVWQTQAGLEPLPVVCKTHKLTTIPPHPHQTTTWIISTFAIK